MVVVDLVVAVVVVAVAVMLIVGGVVGMLRNGVGWRPRFLGFPRKIVAPETFLYFQGEPFARFMINEFPCFVFAFFYEFIFYRYNIV